MSGIFGVVSKKDCVDTLFYGTDYHSHLGTQFAGLATYDKSFNKKIHDINGSQFKSKFFSELGGFKGNLGIGVISALYPQPIYINSKFGQFAICTNGFIDNAEELAKEMLRDGESFSDSFDGHINTTELVAKLINKGKTITEGIEYMFSKIVGSCTLLILTKDGIWAARDRLGYTPLVIGERQGGFAITTETTAFLNLGFKIKKFLLPGEISFINLSGMKPQNTAKKEKQICSFLWIYTGFPASIYEGINVEVVRERCGRFLAKGDKAKIDLVAGIPDSGTTHAIGYAMQAKVPFRRPLVKYTPGYDRSYTPPSQARRDLIAKMKLVAIKDVIEGKSMVFCDDSIVRGTQLKNFTIHKLRENGAKEIHLRIACPPLMFPCKFNYSTRSIHELASRKAIKAIEKKDIADVSKYLDEDGRNYKEMVSWIEKDLNVTSLKYQKLSDMITAIGLPKKDLCLYCWTGNAIR
ncbi:MAG: amidophosphoribosyltransferase [Candidatus Omnitrophota bacterium]|nr:amidophosphoribosyltransferase [Candidatus Omnitrophota bacterium]